jgi:ribosomal protein S27AE
MSRNKYPQRRKCPYCGKIVSEFDGRCYSSKCYGMEFNTATKTDKSKGKP